MLKDMFTHTQSSTVRRKAVTVIAIGVIAGMTLTGLVLGSQATPAGAETLPTPTPTWTIATEGPGFLQSLTTTTPVVTTPTPAFNRSLYSISDPRSPWVIVNKKRPLSPMTYAPSDLVSVPVPYTWQPKLRASASSAVTAMFAAFTAQTGQRLQSQSAYRSYATQADTYMQDVRTMGQKAADLSTARPGYSEHQTGLAIDVGAVGGACSFSGCFASTAHGRWLATNAWRYGFILRYPADKTGITGYGFEPWHFRYVGKELAAEMQRTHVTTLEEFFRTGSAPSY